MVLMARDGTCVWGIRLAFDCGVLGIEHFVVALRIPKRGRAETSQGTSG